MFSRPFPQITFFYKSALLQHLIEHSCLGIVLYSQYKIFIVIYVKFNFVCLRFNTSMKTFGVFLMPSCNFMLTYISIQSKTNKNKETDGSKQQQKNCKKSAVADTVYSSTILVYILDRQSFMVRNCYVLYCYTKTIHA